ncbi:NYN domain-containing protein [Adhaeretor mobilis]|uniref:YacP-like NYN domain protein n=1 Tax=Adhaeretor mobilis TaxID=1930276 RepID=A0A517MYX8_9BACT|nr:NYN domain-containing protein [Adhaeretor mobilis]QDT00077.1 YacP-like NYN domain protein [Adhaeretor mobilis]
MALLIDGYNLLHQAGIFGPGRGGASLQRSREALLRFLAASIAPPELPRTTIVFDAAEAPPGLPRTITHTGMTVHYASEYEDADAMIEELIAADHSPRKLLVVSSDHRLQRAARKRRAPFIDSDVWYAQLIRDRERRGKSAEKPSPSKPSGQLSSKEVEYWLEEFQVEEGEKPHKSPDRPAKPPAELPLDNPFPPGYAEDLFDDENGSG